MAGTAHLYALLDSNTWKRALESRMTPFSLAVCLVGGSLFCVCLSWRFMLCCPGWPRFPVAKGSSGLRFSSTRDSRHVPQLPALLTLTTKGKGCKQAQLLPRASESMLPYLITVCGKRDFRGVVTLMILK